jgi:hypothetical protein
MGCVDWVDDPTETDDEEAEQVEDGRTEPDANAVADASVDIESVPEPTAQEREIAEAIHRGELIFLPDPRHFWDLQCVHIEFLAEEAVIRLKEAWRAKTRDGQRVLAKEFEVIFAKDIYDFLNTLERSTEWTDDSAVPKFRERLPSYSAANWIIRMGRRDTFVRILIFQMLMDVSTSSPLKEYPLIPAAVGCSPDIWERV